MTTTTAELATSPAHLMELFAAHAAAGDLDALVSLYEPDAVFVPEYGVAITGPGELRRSLPEFLAMRPQISYERPPDVAIVDDLALVTNFWSMEATAPDGSVLREAGISADVCRRRSDGSWGVLIDQPRGEPIS